MATTTIVHQDWNALEARALDLFCTHRNLTWDDSLLAALVEERAPALAARALRLVDDDGGTPFSLAFRICRTTDREYGDAAPVPVKPRRAA